MPQFNLHLNKYLFLYFRFYFTVSGFHLLSHRAGEYIIINLLYKQIHNNHFLFFKIAISLGTENTESLYTNFTFLY